MDRGTGAWAALLRAHAHLVPLIGDELERTTGMPLSWYDVLLELSVAPDGRLRMSELGARVVLSRSRVSRVVDELLAAGLVRKIPDRDDGRSSFAELTAKGRERQRRAAGAYLRLIEQRFTSHLTSRELTTLEGALSKVLTEGGRTRT